MQKLPFVTKEKILEMKENKEEFVLVDALSEDSYKEGHLPDAVNIGARDVEEKASELIPNKDITVITYCSSYTCHASTNTARNLQEMGYKNVYDYKGGKKDWREAGLPLVSASE